MKGSEDRKLTTEEEYMLLVEIGKALTSSLDLEDVLRTVMEKVDVVASPRAWSLLLVDERTEELVFVRAISEVGDQLVGMRIPPGTGIAGWVATTGRSLLVPDVAADPRFSDMVDKIVAFRTRSVVGIPLRCRGRVVGVLELINSIEERSFDPEDIPILETIADFAAIAVENARNVEKINNLVITDDLTGLYNSRHFRELLDYEVARTKRYGGSVSLVFIDLDHFKEVNDTHGHLVGSRLLTEIGGLIRDNVRKVDRAVRYGGDEFVLILPNTGTDGACIVVSHLHRMIREFRMSIHDGVTVGVTASFGVATYPEDVADTDALIRAADRAMYDVKESTRDGFRTAAASGSAAAP